ncbi:unnamed protein product [Ostreobium quekettii]|uniref:Arf-GAP domain-containing protein n=1 Tax=Ostreobium quekettii TaxID=121088 RepID=A0A8S1ISX6_9CHLO|nr:unnamed protein product [Ostreobium quekettii]
MCLECSGQHRGLGVHISFVRSVTMDAWTPEQLKKMELGGNGRLIAFMKQYGLDKGTAHRDKYNSPAAEYYRELLTSECEGRRCALTPPPKSSSRSSGPSRPKKAEDDGWSDWGAGAPTPQGSKRPEARGEYTAAALEASSAQKEAFFSRKMEENAQRPEGVRPSAGGKYVGFGSTPPPQPRHGGGDEVTAILSKGWNGLSHIAGMAAETAQSAVRSGAATLKDERVAERVQQNARLATEKGKEIGRKGWVGLKSLYATVASSVESVAKDNGYNIDLGAKGVSNSVKRNAAMARAGPAYHGVSSVGDLPSMETRTGNGFSGFGGNEGDTDADNSWQGTQRDGKPADAPGGMARPWSEPSLVSKTKAPGKPATKVADDWGGWGDGDNEDQKDDVDDDWGKW